MEKENENKSMLSANENHMYNVPSINYKMSDHFLSEITYPHIFLPISYSFFHINI